MILQKQQQQQRLNNQSQLYMLCQQFLQQLADSTASFSPAGQLQWLGPVKAPLERKAGKYRWQLQLFSPQRKSLHQLLQLLLQLWQSIRLVSRLHCHG